jgi:hypothetical protein
MVNGTMRKNYVADKFTIAASWDMVPSVDSETVDRKLGAAAMKAFYESSASQAAVAVMLNYDGVNVSKTMMVSDFSYEVVKRSLRGYDLCNVSISLEEM